MNAPTTDIDLWSPATLADRINSSIRGLDRLVVRVVE